MNLSEEERAHNREAFRAMRLGDKLAYIFAYYKLPLVIAGIALVSVISVARWYLTAKDHLLYVAYANVAVSEDFDAALFDGFLLAESAPARTDVYRYMGLYLAEEAGADTHQYAYASKLKVMAAVDAEELDVILMNQESYDLLSRSGYLLDLRTWLGEADPALLAQVEGLLEENEVVLEDNQVELDLGEADQYEAVTEAHVNALRVSELPIFAEAHLSDEVYLGVIGNTPRLDTVRALIAYLTD